MDNTLIKHLVNCVRILQIENAKNQYEYEYLLSYMNDDNPYFDDNKEEDEDYTRRIQEFNDEINKIKNE